jgi:hypothetical protein
MFPKAKNQCNTLSNCIHQLAIHDSSLRPIHKQKLSKVQSRSMNFLYCVIPVHKLSKCVITVPKLKLSL